MDLQSSPPLPAAAPGGARPAGSDPPARLHRYVTIWVLAGIGATVTLALSTSTAEATTAPRFALVVLAVTVAELTELHFRLSPRLTSAFTLIEAGVVAAIVLLPPTEAVLAVAASSVLTNLLRGRPMIKLGFNTAQVTVSTAAAATVAHLLLPAVGPRVGGAAVLPALAGMAVYGLVNFAALAGLLRTVGDGDVRATIREQGWLTAAALLGDVPIGLLGAELALSRPQLLVLLLAPAVAVHLAQRGVARTQELLAQAREDHERLDRIVAGTSDGILLLGEDGRIEVWNDALEDMTGIPRARSVGGPVDRVLSGVRLDRPIGPRWLIDDAEPGSPTQVVEARLQHVVDGHVRVVRESHTFRFDDRGRCVGDVVVLTDVTREHEVARLKSDFVARVSHELRTPLTPIKGFAGMLLKRGSEMSEEQQTLALERIVERTDRMAALVEDLLLVTQLGSEVDGVVVPRRCDVAVIVEEIVAGMRAAHAGRELYVSAGTGPVDAMADPERTAQVLTHLVDNALRYSDPDTPVGVEVSVESDDVAVRVIDHGPGIPTAHQEAIFEPFHRLEDPLRMRTSGVGVGLFIARRLAHAMHGNVTVRSRVGKGSTFALRLPRHRPAAPPTPSMEHPAHPVEPSE